LPANYKDLTVHDIYLTKRLSRYRYIKISANSVEWAVLQWHNIKKNGTCLQFHMGIKRKKSKLTKYFQEMIFKVLNMSPAPAYELLDVNVHHNYKKIQQRKTSKVQPNDFYHQHGAFICPLCKVYMHREFPVFVGALAETAFKHF
jgi:hypothetical protein